MKNLIKVFICTFIFCLTMSVVYAKENNAKIWYTESILPYKGGLLISNHGNYTTNKDILFYKRGKIKTFIPFGFSDAPTAMAVYKNRLYVCDKDKLWAFDLNDINNPPQKILFTPEDNIINDIAEKDGILYITATDTDRIYKIDLNKKQIKPELWINLPSPNGISIKNNTVYVASIPKDYANPTEENVVYVIKDISNPYAKKLNKTPRIYDGIAVSKMGEVYVSDWKTASIIKINKHGKEFVVYHRRGMTPADISLKNDKLIIPDMFNKRIILYNLRTKHEKIIQ